MEPELPLNGGGGGGTSGTMIPIKEYIDARDDAIESRLGAKLDKLPSSKEMWGMVAAIVGGVLTIIIAALAFLGFAGDRFNAGLTVSPAIEASQKRQAGIDQKQDAQLQLMDQKLDILIKQTAKR